MPEHFDRAPRLVDIGGGRVAAPDKGVGPAADRSDAAGDVLVGARLAALADALVPARAFLWRRRRHGAAEYAARPRLAAARAGEPARSEVRSQQAAAAGGCRGAAAAAPHPANGDGRARAVLQRSGTGAAAARPAAG